MAVMGRSHRMMTRAMERKALGEPEGQNVNDNATGKKPGRRRGTTKRAKVAANRGKVGGCLVVDRALGGSDNARRLTELVLEGNPDENYVRVVPRGTSHKGEELDYREALGRRFWHKGQWRTPSKAEAEVLEWLDFEADGRDLVELLRLGVRHAPNVSRKPRASARMREHT